jgi:hypothetical protein
MALDPRPHQERRQTTLSDHDLERIGETFDRKMQGLFEVIGYDTSTPESRKEIRSDHEFIREARNAKGRIIGAMYVAIGSGLVGLFYLGAKAVGKAP